MDKENPVVLVIAGYDPSGASGVIRDVKTLGKLGVYGIATVTAITVQNVSEVQEVVPLSPGTVRKQIIALLEEFPVEYAKVGMLATGDVAREVAKIIEDRGIKAVVDPVLRSSSGYPLVDSPESIKPILRAAEVITPNVPEAEILSGIRIRNREDMIRAGKKLEDMYGCTVVKGGHLGGEDMLFCGEMHSVRLEKLPYEVRGTGCAFSSALAAFLSRGYGIREAFVNSRLFVQREMENSLPFGNSRVMP